ncbi:hypothetical protein C1645_793872 [Glomus cerebriforme]|uniref:Uncharacterized protein n=1 Tax=Glomus cerebriforme TaxID=658196 RepID=A0A397S6T6_9GLOM|nr:hypothetical protein C1645_793872 [Glomus cerebriforme]
MSITRILSIAVATIIVITFTIGTNAIEYQVSCGTYNLHSAPDSTSSVLGSVGEKLTVDVVCQTAGSDAIADFSPGASYNVWDKLADGSYISDLYVYTPNCGFDTTNTIPKC